MQELLDQGIIRKKDKLAIIGTADSKSLAPFGNTEWDLVGVNNLYAFAPPNTFQYWFEIHQFHFDGNNFFRRGKIDFRGKKVNDYLAELDSLGIPVFMQQKWPQIKNSVVFPWKPIVNKYGTYFTNTISWQIAWGLEMGYKKIGIWGVDMAVGEEYKAQRASCEYFIGLARGMGVEVYIPPEADLLKSRFMYAIQELQEDDFTKKCKMVIQKMGERQNQSAFARDQESKKVEQYTGAMSAVQEIMKIWETCRGKD